MVAALAGLVSPVVGKTKGVNDAFFDFVDSLFILAELFVLMPTADASKLGSSIRAPARPEHKNITKCLLKPSVPKPAGLDVGPGCVICVCRLMKG